ncbi:MAG: thioredoxin [Firmicutes bacterium]|nr:thioredoxin [Bacillota bacterium]
MRELPANEFEGAVASDKLTIVDFWAEWCPPCKMLVPVLEELSAETTDATIYKFDVQNEANRPLTQKYEIKNIPAVLFFKNGVEIHRELGFKPKETWLELIENLK